MAPVACGKSQRPRGVEAHTRERKRPDVDHRIDSRIPAPAERRIAALSCEVIMATTWQATSVEEIPPRERAAIRRMIQLLKARLDKHYRAKGALMRRDAHPKTVALVRARFIVSPDCPHDLRPGLFADRGPQKFEAIVRFSNGNPDVAHDLSPDIRGMAIKLPDVQGAFLDGEPGQDFLLATEEAFFGRNALDFVGFVKASTNALKVIGYFLPPWRWRGAFHFLRGTVSPRSPLAIEYFSQTPYRLGPQCVKYRARPIRERTPWYMRTGIRTLIGAASKFFPKFGLR